MRLHPKGVEYYRLTLTTDPATGPTDWSASFDDGTTWTTAADVDGEAGWLIAGPDADTPGVARILPAGTTRPIVRHVDNPETIIRSAPPILVSR